MALCLRAERSLSLIVCPNHLPYSTLRLLFDSSKPSDDSVFSEFAAPSSYANALEGQVARHSQWRKVNAKRCGIFGSMIPGGPWTILKVLRVRGFDSYLVGGCVRDLLLNRTPKDFDVITTAKLSQVKSEFRCARIVGKRFPICQVIIRDSTVEVSSFETRSEKKNKLDLDKITDKCDKKDAIRWRDSVHRDFTVNSLFYDPFENMIFDYTNGINDLKKLKLRTLIPAKISFQEDCGRILRGLRIAGRLGLSISEDTAIAMHELSSSILSLTKGRIMMEMNYMLAYGASESTILLLHKFHLLQRILPFQAAYLDRQIKQQTLPTCVLINLLRHLDKHFSCAHPCPTVIWVALLAFHQALAAYPQKLLVIRTVAAILCYNKRGRALNYLKESAIDFQAYESDEKLLNEALQLANLVQDAMKALCCVDYLSKYMACIGVSSYVSTVLVSDRLEKESAGLFDVIGGAPKKRERNCFNINFPLLYRGNAMETRFALGKIILESFAKGENENVFKNELSPQDEMKLNEDPIEKKEEFALKTEENCKDIALKLEEDCEDVKEVALATENVKKKRTYKKKEKKGIEESEVAVKQKEKRVGKKTKKESVGSSEEENMKIKKPVKKREKKVCQKKVSIDDNESCGDSINGSEGDTLKAKNSKKKKVKEVEKPEKCDGLCDAGDSVKGEMLKVRKPLKKVLKDAASKEVKKDHDANEGSKKVRDTLQSSLFKLFR